MTSHKMSVPIRPVMDPLSETFWASLREKQVTLQECSECARLRFPPYPSCPYCGSDNGAWVPVSENARLYSWVVVHAPISPDLKNDVPYVVGLVQLDDGPRMIGRVIGCDVEELKREMPVRFHYHKVDSELTLLVFEAGH